jgi:hypothetical protein
MKVKYFGLSAALLLMSLVFSACQTAQLNTKQVMDNEVMNESKGQVLNPNEAMTDKEQTSPSLSTNYVDYKTETYEQSKDKRRVFFFPCKLVSNV